MTALESRQDQGTPETLLDTPQSVLPLEADNTMDDGFFLALDGQRVPFRIPPYDAISAGDSVFLWLNGEFVGAPPSVDPARGAIVNVDPSLFQFSGTATVFYTVQDSGTTDPGNKGTSAPLVLHVVRHDFKNPWPGTYPPPMVNPPVYAQAQLDGAASVQVTVAYPLMAVTDTISLHFDLLATTSDQPPNTFYALPQAIPGQQGSAAGAIAFTLDSGQFKGIDENIGHVYYAVARLATQNHPELYPQSIRADFDVDTVAPFN